MEQKVSLLFPIVPEDESVKRDILAHTWFSPMSGPCIGVVAVKGLDGIDWSAYIGTYNRYSSDQERDIQNIAARGARVGEAAARALMPELEHLTEGLPYRA